MKYSKFRVHFVVMSMVLLLQNSIHAQDSHRFELVGTGIKIPRNQIMVNKRGIEFVFKNEQKHTDNIKVYIDGELYLKSSKLAVLQNRNPYTAPLGASVAPPEKKEVIMISKVATISPKNAAETIASSPLENLRESKVVSPKKTIIIDNTKTVVDDNIPSTVKSNVKASLVDKKVVDNTSDLGKTINQSSTVYSTPLDNSDLESVIRKRLKKLLNEDNFNLTYHSNIDAYIDQMLHFKKDDLERILYKSHYYFPNFEQELKNNNLPRLLKYFPALISELEPRKNSDIIRYGSGLWGLTKIEAELANLRVDTIVDQRLDPKIATKVAVKKLKKLYNKHQNWDSAILAYLLNDYNYDSYDLNGNNKIEYQEAHSHLSKEEKRFLPELLSYIYLLEYASEHNLGNKYKAMHSKDVSNQIITKDISLEETAKILDIEPSRLQFLNPMYVSGKIQITQGEVRTINIPKDKVEKFSKRKDTIYELSKDPNRIIPVEVKVVNQDNNNSSKGKGVESTVASSVSNSSLNKPKVSKVKNLVKVPTEAELYYVEDGDTLTSISRKFNTTVQAIKKNNNLKNNNLKKGQSLWVQGCNYVTDTIKDISNNGLDAKFFEAGKVIPSDTKKSAVTVPKDISSHTEMIIHNVLQGETLWRISQKYKVTVKEIKDWNNLKNDTISLGKQLKIQRAKK